MLWHVCSIGGLLPHFYMSVYVFMCTCDGELMRKCVCVCVTEREREKCAEREGGMGLEGWPWFIHICKHFLLLYLCLLRIHVQSPMPIQNYSAHACTVVVM